MERPSLLAVAFFLALPLSSQAQTATSKMTFALPDHAGRMSLARGAWKTVELSAKQNGLEFGERAEQGEQHLLAFLFVWPEKAALTSAACRDEMLKAEHADASVQGRSSLRSQTGADIALAVMLSPRDANISLRAFVASGDLCGDVLFNATGVQPGDAKAYKAVMETAKQTLLSLTFDPAAKPTFNDAFAYATVEYQKRQYAGAAQAYRAALRLVDESDNPSVFRHVVTDQLSMSLGISGDLKGSREVNEKAITADPEYPLYYYNLACADAESGDAKAARDHLQQAFDRRTHTLLGESFPDPTQDDSLQKLKQDRPFWTLAQQVSKTIQKAH